MQEYKVVPAPERAHKVKGLKTTAQRFAHTLAEAINAEAAGGWHFVRTETLPCEERGTLGSVRQTSVTVMVFSRERAQARVEPAQPAPALILEDEALPAAPAAPRREPLFRAGNLMRDGAARPEPVLRPRRTPDDGAERDY